MGNLIQLIRPLLILGRVSNLPTVWSNCLVGWLVCQPNLTGRFLLLLLGATLLYLAGMFLNDAFDAQFDKLHRPERPIPSGRISVAAVWQWGFSLLGLGLLCFGLLGWEPLFWALLLAGCILVYDAVHKIFFLSPVLMAFCRLFLVLAAAAVTETGLTGYAVWVAIVLACYIVGLSYLARNETNPSPMDYWPCILLAAPVVLALIVNRTDDQVRGWVFSLILVAWIIKSLRHTYWASQMNIGRSVGSLLAGIVLVDLLALAGHSLLVTLVLLSLLAMALVFQRFIPAT